MWSRGVECGVFGCGVGVGCRVGVVVSSCLELESDVELGVESSCVELESNVELWY